MDRPGCLDLLRSVSLGRIGLSVDALPVIVPVGFSVLDDRIVFGIRPQARFATALHGMVIALEADQWDPERRTGWTVLVQGPARVLTEAGDLERIAALEASRWWFAESTRVVELATDVVSGRWLGQVGERSGRTRS